MMGFGGGCFPAAAYNPKLEGEKAIGPQRGPRSSAPVPAEHQIGGDLDHAERLRRLRMGHPLEARIPHRDVAAWLKLDRERIAALMPVVNASKRVARRTIDRWGRRHDVAPFAMTYLPYRSF
jgi:hypothetical protein